MLAFLLRAFASVSALGVVVGLGLYSERASLGPDLRAPQVAAPTPATPQRPAGVVPALSAAAALPPPFLERPTNVAAELGASSFVAPDPSLVARLGADAPDPASPAAAAPADPAPAAAAPVPAAAAPAAALVRKGDVAGLEALARTVGDPVVRLALVWAALRSDAHPSYDTLAAFALAHPDWPGLGFVRLQQEADLMRRPRDPAAVIKLFDADAPRSPAGKLAQAIALQAVGRADDAAAVVRALWRGGDFDAWTETAILTRFGGLLAKADHKARADRLLYAESFAPALRAAGLAGPDEAALARARFAAARGSLPPGLVAVVPASLKGDPGLLFARIQDARRSNRAVEAAALLAQAPADAAALINPDRWWSERRMVARQLLDLAQAKLAYDVCVNAATPVEAAARVDAAFHAGWIALRFLDDARAAAGHFQRAFEAAETPLAIARAAYWQGRAAEALGDDAAARGFYARAADNPIAYYGQLAAEKLGRDRLRLHAPSQVAQGAERNESTRAIEFLYTAGLDTLASPLAYEAARQWGDEAQIAALAKVVERHGDVSTEVTFAKLATLRGLPLDAEAFPTRGLPSFAPLAHSADLASVYAVARQESEFLWRASSGAGAKGLMQILPSTAAATARRAGVPYDPQRLVVDPAFNTQLGAAFLGQLIEDEGGSLAVAFAAYNAGGGRVAQWLAAYGDPRKGTVDPVDWVERIPFDETRDYVQRVSENLAVYRQRLAEAGAPAAPSARLARE